MSLADDRRYIIEQWQYLYGGDPTIAEVERHLAYLQNHTRTAWLAEVEKQRAPEAIARLYQQYLGRPPTASQLAGWVAKFQAGTMTRKSLTEYLSGSSEGLLHKAPTAPTPGQEDAKTYLQGILDSYGLGTLGGWAWDQIQAGNSEQRVLQDLRQTTEYKTRFVGMQARAAAGLPAISESEYIAYETSARQMMRAAGMPSDFYDSPEDFAGFIGSDVSVAELNQRVSEGYAAAAQAAPEVRSELNRLYGIDESHLAAFFLDPDRALPLIQRQWSASQMSGAAQRSSYGALNQSEAERLAELGITEQQAQQGFGQLVQSKELFGPMIGTDESAISRDQQQAAVFAGDAGAQGAIEKRSKERVSAGSGAQSFALGQGGVSALQR